MSGNDKFFNGWCVGRARGTPGSSPLWECFWRTVKLLRGPHSSKGSRLIRDEMFLEGASVEVQSVMFGREAAWRPRCQCFVLTPLQVMLVDREFAWRLIWHASFSGHGPRGLRPSLSLQDIFPSESRSSTFSLGRTRHLAENCTVFLKVS